MPKIERPSLHFLLHEILECGLLEGFLGDNIGDVLRDHGDAFAIADEDIAGIDRDLAAGDRDVEVDGVMLDEVGRRRRRRMIGGERQLRDLGRIAEAAVGDDPGCAALPQPRHQDAAGGRGRGIAPAVDDEHVTHRAFLDALALRVAAVLEHAEVIDFLRRDIAHRVGRTDHCRTARIDAMDALDEGVAKAALEQDRGQRGGRHPPPAACFVCSRPSTWYDFPPELIQVLLIEVLLFAGDRCQIYKRTLQ